MNLFELFGKISLDTTGFEKALGIATSALATATGAVTAFATASVNTGKAFDKSMSQVAATMGYTVDELNDDTTDASKNFKALRDFAQEMGESTVFSASQAADALNYMALAGYDAQTSMKMLPTVLNLAASGNMDLARASDMVTDAASALGMTLDDGSVDVEKVTEMIDQMAKTASKSNTSVSQLGDAILTIGGTAQFMSGGVAELSATLGILADNGIKASEGGTHLRNMLLKLASPTDDGAAALNALGVSVFDAEGKMRSMQDVFGDLQRAMSNAAPRVTELFGALEEARKTGDVDTINSALSDLGASMNRLGISLMDDANNFKTLDEVLQDLGDGGLAQATQLQLLSDIFNTRDIAAATALMNTYNERWDELGGYLDNATGAAEAMAATQLDNLTGDVTLFKSALEGAQIAVSDKLTPSIREFVQFGSKAVSNISKAFKDKGLTGAMESLGETLSEGLTMVIEDLPGMVEAGASLLTALGNGIIENLPLLAESAVQIVTMLVQKMTEDLPIILVQVLYMIQQIATYLTNPETLTALLTAVLDCITRIGELIISEIPRMTEVLLTVLDNLATFILDNLPLILETGIELLLAFTKGILEAIPRLVEKLPEVITSIVNALLDALPIIVDCGVELLMALVENMPAIIDGIVNALPELILGLTIGLIDHIDEIIAAGVKLFLGLIAAMPEIILQIVAAMPKIIKGIVQAIIKSIPQLMKAGGQLLQGLWQGISDAGAWLWEKISGFFGGIVDRIKNFFGIKSPSKLFAGIGEMLDKGLAKGIDDYSDVAVSATDDLADDVMDSMSGIKPDLDFTASANGTRNGYDAKRNGVIINVYGAVGQDVEELADIVSQKISFAYRQEQAVWA